MDNIKIAEQLKKLQENILSVLEAQESTQKSQLEITKEMVKSVSEISTSSDNTVEKLEQTRDALEKAAEAASKMSRNGAASTFAEQLKKAAKNGTSLKDALKAAVKQMPGFAAFAGIWSGFTEGITFSANALRLFTSFSMTALEAMGQLAISILTFPFKILSNLISFASSGGGDNGLRQALEDIRKEFGDLHKASSAAIIGMARNMKGQLANTGLSIYRTFGMLAERLKTITEYAKNMGPLFAVLSGQFVDNAEAIGVYFKGLGLTEEGQKAVGTRAMALGQDITEVTRQMTNYSVQLGDQFGLSSKEISRDIGNMMADFEHFGGMAPQMLAQISTYARRLGTDIKALDGVIDQFDNFENAARSAAQLTQAFGLQIDAVEMLKTQDVAERTEMLRKSFFAAGRSIENMTRQERALLQQQTGLEASSLALIFSQKSQGLSYEQVKKKSENAQKSQLTQAEAMQKLANSIERLVRSGSMGGGGFFERFFQGFERGILRSREFRQLMIDIRMALRATYWAGAEVGRMFVDMFPGVEQLVKGLRGLFDRNRFRAMLTELKNTFRTFFSDLTSPNSKSSFKNLMDNLKRMFWNYFDGSSPAGKSLLDGFKNFAKAAAVIVAGMIGEIAKGLTQGIRFIADILSGRQSLGDLSKGGQGAIGFIFELLDPIIEAVKEAWPPLVAALEDLFMEEIWPRVRDFLLDHALVIGAVLFGPGILNAIFSGVVGAIGATVTESLTKGLLAGIGEVASSGSVKNALTKGMSSVFGGASSGVAASIASTGEAAVAAQASPITGAEVGKMALIAIFIAVGIMAVLAAITLLAQYIQEHKITTKSMLTASATMIAAGAVILELAGVLQIAATINAGATAAVPALVALGIMAAALGAFLYGFVWAMSDFKESQIRTSMIALAAGGAFLAEAVLILGAAMLIGTEMISSGGLGAGAAFIGLTAIAGAVGTMTALVTNIIDEVSKLNIPSDFDRKFDVYTKALNSVTTFGTMVAEISNSTSSSSLSEWVFGDGDRQIRVLEQLKNTIIGITNQMMSIINQLIARISTIETGPEILQRVDIFANIMEGFGRLNDAVTPPDGLMTARFGFSVEGQLTGFALAVGSIIDAMIVLMNSVVTNLTRITSLSLLPEDISGLEMVGRIITTLGSFARSMIVLVNQNYSSLTGDELQQRMPQIAEAVTSLVNGIFMGENGIATLIPTLMTGITSGLSGLSSVDMTRVTKVGPMLTTAFEAIATVAATIGQLSTIVQEMPSEARGAAIGTINQIVTNMFSGIRTVGVGILTSLKGLFEGMTGGQIANLSKGVSAFKSMIEAVATLPESLGTLQEILMQGNDGNYQAMRDRLGTIISLFSESDTSGNLGLPALFRGMAGAFNGLPELEGNPAEKMKRLADSLGSLQEIASLPFTTLAANLEANAAALRSEAFTHVATNIRAMVAQVNSIAHDLGAVEPININSSLKRLAGRFGLGSNDEITIRNRDFTIQVNLEVHMDARELERTLIERPNTQIMHKGQAGGT